MLVEILLIAAAATSAEPIHRFFTGSPSGHSDLAFGVGLLAGVVHAAMARSTGLYRLPALIDPLPFARRHLSVCALVLLVITGVFFCLKTGAEFSRATLAVVAALLPVTCSLSRLSSAPILAAMVRSGAVTGRPVVILGEESEIEGLDAFYLLSHYGLDDVGRIVFDLASGSAASALAEAVRVSRQAGAQAFVATAAWRAPGDLQIVEKALAASPLPIQLLPGAVLRSVIDREGLAQDRSRHLVTLRRAPLGSLERAGKRALDVTVAAMALSLLLPLLGVVALAIRLDSSGPVLFRQRRSGFDERQFTILKFRTMAHRTCAHLEQARRGDPRVTRVGAFLRRSSIDELPQLLNVLRGDMSLVGPRPHAIEHDQEYRMLVGNYVLRHHVRPGMTGWAQVNGQRGETSEPDRVVRRVDLDLWYIGNWSLLLDAAILCRTVAEVMKLDAY